MSKLYHQHNIYNITTGRDINTSNYNTKDIINSEDVVRLIEKLRGNEFDETYDEKWAIAKQGFTDYHKKILMYLQTHGNNQISA